MKFIAELCQNHCGDLDTLLSMVESAATGATHIKMQHIYVKNLTFRPQFEEGLKNKHEIHAIKSILES